MTTPREDTRSQATRDTIKELLEDEVLRGHPPEGIQQDPPRYRFFLDYDGENLNVYAVSTNRGLYEGRPEFWTGDAHEVYCDTGAVGQPCEGLAATFPRENSSVSWVGLTPEVLGPEISRDLAKKIHPRLFERIARHATE